MQKFFGPIFALRKTLEHVEYNKEEIFEKFDKIKNLAHTLVLDYFLTKSLLTYDCVGGGSPNFAYRHNFR